MKNILFTLTILFSAVSLFAARYYVTPSGKDTNSGKTWHVSFASVQAAIDAAAKDATLESPGEVWIAKGTYKNGSPLRMKMHVKIYGGFRGNEMLLKQRVPGNETILDGENKYQVIVNDYTKEFEAYKEYEELISKKDEESEGETEEIPEVKRLILTETSLLDSVTIANAKGSLGGGIYNKYASPTISNCTFRDNEATSKGGAIANEGSNLKVLACTFVNNKSDIGGAIYNGKGTSMNSEDYRDSPPVFTNCTFYANTAGTNGGAVASDEETSEPEYINCTFTNNVAKSKGGAIYKSELSIFTLTNCIIWNNTAKTDNEFSGIGDNVTLKSCVIKDYVGSNMNVITTDPKLQGLADNGGMVQTVALGTGSSAIYAGQIVEGVESDARDMGRSQDTPTIGANEYVVRPDIVVEPLPFKASEGDSRELVVSVTGGGKMTYKWYYNGKFIRNSDSAVLLIDNIRASNAGTYYCVITNPMGTVQSKTVQVRVSKYTGICYVVEGGSGDMDGTSWENAFAKVQPAINVAHNMGGGEVWIAQGTYKYGSAMTMKNNVAIYGGFTGTETSNSQRDSKNETILDGENSYQVFVNDYTNVSNDKSKVLTESAVLDTVTIANGSGQFGGGIYNKWA
ncbi:MAG: immunoglobulin domain-containing protein, partial [Opitutales bacterium]|nr:immunoglobulin domain-containing protein [Opitutales bacterium]